MSPTDQGFTHYVIVRRDLPFGTTCAQIAHAAGESFYLLNAGAVLADRKAEGEIPSSGSTLASSSGKERPVGNDGEDGGLAPSSPASYCTCSANGIQLPGAHSPDCSMSLQSGVVQGEHAPRVSRSDGEIVGVTPYAPGQLHRPTYNHTRGDSAETPCPQCKSFLEDDYLPASLYLGDRTFDLKPRLQRFLEQRGVLPPEVPKPTVVILGARSEQRLLTLERQLTEVGVRHVAVREPDAPWDNALMAIGLVPGEKSDLYPHVRDFHILPDRESRYDALRQAWLKVLEHSEQFPEDRESLEPWASNQSALNTYAEKLTRAE